MRLLGNLGGQRVQLLEARITSAIHRAQLPRILRLLGRLSLHKLNGALRVLKAAVSRTRAYASRSPFFLNISMTSLLGSVSQWPWSSHDVATAAAFQEQTWSAGTAPSTVPRCFSDMGSGVQRQSPCAW